METGLGFRRLFLFWSTLFMDFSPGASDPLMYYIDTINIWSYDLQTGNTSMLVPSALLLPVNMDFHHGNQKLYVSDLGSWNESGKLYSFDLSASSLEPTLEVLLSNVVVCGLAVDWINNNLYWIDWTDSGNTLT